ncbi:molecular chaperone DnaJ [Maridesulfovibrio ferrireducens]|uniref:molecular chaperone DnaJ n=1 Tax=Maridesulfovibrio ferrireducens TaxID=246191 RepID=UPI001A34D946|nr:molecular chaperone DnaJ [Maridesulfovibrio ferrireducens]MBI9111538.1 molecular chaperone DnaJ [Maridesulfovibrio ferrireducens]
MSKRDYYEILQVSKDSPEGEIKRAYRKMAFEYHPDRNPGDDEAESKFKEAAEAYEILRDPEKRSRYDRFGHEGMNGGFNGFKSSDDIFGAFGDIFGDIFGFSQGRGGKRMQAGSDLRYNLTVSFRDAAKGTEVELNLPITDTCEECNGSGSAPGTSPETCSHCGGRGTVVQNQGFFQISVPCPSCNGRGQVITDPCSACRGAGYVRKDKSLNVRIPAGVDNGSRLRLRGEGEAGMNGGPHGDLYVVITVQPDKVFRRQGQDLVLTTEISFVQAALGYKMSVQTLDEPIDMDIPKGTQSGEVFQLRGLGLPYLGSSHKGDLLVEVKVVTPINLSRKQEELLEQFAALEEDKPMKKVKKLFKKAKDKVMGD